MVQIDMLSDPTGPYPPLALRPFLQQCAEHAEVLFSAGFQVAARPVQAQDWLLAGQVHR